MKQVILDTDIGADSDDIGAVSILQNFYKRGLINILAMTSVSSKLVSAQALDAINCYYLNPVTIGINKNDNYGSSEKYGIYSKSICEKYPSNHQDFKNSIDVLKEALKNADQDVVLITIGPLCNIYYLLKDNEGFNLVKEKVKIMYSMAGNFVEKTCEWNIDEDRQAAKYVINNFPNEIVMVPFEVGANVFTARNLLNSTSPMQVGYEVHNHGIRQSWDPITAFYAVTNDKRFTLSNYGTIEIDDNGVTSFKEGFGKHRYMKNTFNIDEITNALEEVMKP